MSEPAWKIDAPPAWVDEAALRGVERIRNRLTNEGIEIALTWQQWSRFSAIMQSEISNTLWAHSGRKGRDA